MPKIVILGSCKYEPYEILAVPNKIPNAWNTERGYQIAAKKFYPAIKEADIVLVYAPDGIGEHTKRDIEEARRQNKEIYIIVHESALNEKNALLEEFRDAVTAKSIKIKELEGRLTTTLSLIDKISADLKFAGDKTIMSVADVQRMLKRLRRHLNDT